MKKKIENLVIIGSGPAGVTAGIYSARANLSPIIIDGENPGGQLMKTTYVENWPGEKKILGPTLMMNMREHAKNLGCHFLEETIIEVDFSKRPFRIILSNRSTINTHAIIISTGASPKKLECPGEETYWGKGITSCAVCDGALYKDKKVIVVGGGDTAMEYASFLSKFTKDITVIHILDTLTASMTLQKRVLKDPDIKIILNSTIISFEGDQNRLTTVIIHNKKTNRQQIIATDGAFIAIGQNPNTEVFKNKIDIDTHGYIKLTDNTKTSIEGIFVAGDVSDYRYRQAITAAGSGCMAAIDAGNYLSHKIDR